MIAAVLMILGAATTPALALAQCNLNGAPDNCSVPGSVSMTAGRVVRLQMTAGSTSLTAPTLALRPQSAARAAAASCGGCVS